MELITLKNSALTVTLDPEGAVLHSIVKDGLEYLWQGNSAYWKRRDANLFPYVGRLTDGVYELDGKRYPLPIHGFCIGTPFTVTRQGGDFVRFTLEDNAQRLQQYPFRFAFHVDYRLEGNTIVKGCTVENRSGREMYFGIGGHPGFNVPLDTDDFQDWKLVFSEASQPVRIDFDPANYRLAGTEGPFPLKDGTTIALTHSLFDLDAVVLQHMPRTVTICSEKSRRSVTVLILICPSWDFGTPPRPMRLMSASNPGSACLPTVPMWRI